MANITRKFQIGAVVRFADNAFRSMTVREWARDTMTVEKVDGADVWIVNARTGQTVMVDSCDIEMVRGNE